MTTMTEAPVLSWQIELLDHADRWQYEGSFTSKDVAERTADRYRKRGEIVRVRESYLPATGLRQ